MKEGLKRRYHKFSWDFTDWLMQRPQARGHAKKVQHLIFNKGARLEEKRFLKNELKNL